MNDLQTETILQNFYEMEVTKSRENHLLALERYFQGSLDVLAEEFRNAFKTICSELCTQQVEREKEPIGHITFSLLRTELLERNPIYLVEGTNEDWFLDFKPIITFYDASWLLRFLFQQMEELRERSRTFLGVISEADLDSIMLKEVNHYHQYLISLARYALMDMDAFYEYVNLARHQIVEIRIGEYLDYSELVFKEDYTEKDLGEVKAWLNEKLENRYVFESFRELDLSHEDYSSLDLRYTFFQKSNLSNSKLREAILIGANFKNSELVNTDLSFSLIHEADFSHCHLQGANFLRAKGFSGLEQPTKWDKPGYVPVRFNGANLQGANFEQADLRGASFIGANLKDVNFTNAKLDRAIFSKEAKEFLTLDPRQIHSIIWK